MTDLYAAITEIPNGRFFKIIYKTPVPVKAKYKKEGIQVYKITSRVTRTGIAYNNLKSVKGTELDYTHNINTKWIIKNKVKLNFKTGKDYLVIAPMKSGEHKIVTYVIEDILSKTYTTVLPEEYVINSYLTKKNGAVRNIDLNNIVSISYAGKELYAIDINRSGVCEEDQRNNL